MPQVRGFARNSPLDPSLRAREAFRKQRMRPHRPSYTPRGRPWGLPRNSDRLCRPPGTRRGLCGQTYPLPNLAPSPMADPFRAWATSRSPQASRVHDPHRIKVNPRRGGGAHRLQVDHTHIARPFEPHLFKIKGVAAGHLWPDHHGLVVVGKAWPPSRHTLVLPQAPARLPDTQTAPSSDRPD